MAEEIGLVGLSLIPSLVLVLLVFLTNTYLFLEFVMRQQQRAVQEPKRYNNRGAKTRGLAFFLFSSLFSPFSFSLPSLSIPPSLLSSLRALETVE